MGKLTGARNRKRKQWEGAFRDAYFSRYGSAGLARHLGMPSVDEEVRTRDQGDRLADAARDPGMVLRIWTRAGESGDFRYADCVQDGPVAVLLRGWSGAVSVQVHAWGDRFVVGRPAFELWLGSIWGPVPGRLNREALTTGPAGGR